MYDSSISVQDDNSAELLAERRRSGFAAAALLFLALSAGLYSVLFHDSQRDYGGCGQLNCITLVSS